MATDAGTPDAGTPDAATPDAGTQTVTKQADRSRFEIAVGGARAGFAQYVDDNGRRIFFHTVIDDAHSGQGLAGVLVREALDATQEEGLRIIAVCPYVAKYVGRHHDWDDSVDRVDRAALAAVQQVAEDDL